MPAEAIRILIPSPVGAGTSTTEAIPSAQRTARMHPSLGDSFAGTVPESTGNVAEMALLYQATLSPTKMELLQAWVPTQPWSGGSDGSAELESVGAYRFDDPEGEVGVETHLVRAVDGRILQVPVTYRAAPLPGAESFLVGTSDHSVLGERWVYDACADPVYVSALATAILQGGTQADIEVMTDAGPRPWEATTKVSGSGSPDTGVPPVGAVHPTNEGATTVIGTASFTLFVVREIESAGDPAPPGPQETLRGTWPGRETAALLAYLEHP
jgi:Maltokinase N-terminal cap domain